jgi:hypothetical protein
MGWSGAETKANHSFPRLRDKGWALEDRAILKSEKSGGSRTDRTDPTNRTNGMNRIERNHSPCAKEGQARISRDFLRRFCHVLECMLERGRQFDAIGKLPM